MKKKIFLAVSVFGNLFQDLVAPIQFMLEEWPMWEFDAAHCVFRNSSIPEQGSTSKGLETLENLNLIDLETSNRPH